MKSKVVARDLGLGESYREWLSELEAGGPPPQRVVLPDEWRTRELLASLRVDQVDAVELLAARPDRERHPQLWWLLERCHHRLVRSFGDDAPLDHWPALPEALGPAGRCLYAYVFLAALEQTRTWHRRHGVPDAVSWETLSAVGLSIAAYRRDHGHTGFVPSGWLALHLRGGVYTIGRLQYTPFLLCTEPGGPRFWYDDATLAKLGAGFQPGDPSLGIHIPGGGPLTPESCDQSIATARGAFASYFNGPQCRVAVCTSWLLDEQLAEYLPAASNLVRFQRRFTMVPGAAVADADVRANVFGVYDADTALRTPRTSLERAVVEHLSRGRHWRMRTGWLDISGNDSAAN